jgi:hypothetical protein
MRCLLRGALCAVLFFVPTLHYAGDFSTIKARWVDVYAEAQKDERIAQALYGEPVIVEAAQRGWSRIRLLYHVELHEGVWQNTRGWVRYTL